MTDRNRSQSPTPRERAVMSERELMEFTLDRTDAISETILDLATTIATYHGEAKGGIERMSYVAMKIEELAQDHEKRIRKLEHKVIWAIGAAAGAGLILGVLMK
jgi:hypothetical protein